MRQKNTLTDFWNLVDKTTNPNGCWEWQGPRQSSKQGSLWHGIFSLSAVASTKLTHRLSWIIHFGQIPKNQCVLHKCDNPACVNPSHLFLGTQIDNVNDMMQKGRHADQKGIKSVHAKLTENDVKWIRANSNLNSKDLGAKFGVSGASINDVKKYRSWTHI